MLCRVLFDSGDSSIMGYYVVYCLMLEIKYHGILCCVLLDAGDSSIMGCYVVYSLMLEIQVSWDIMLCTA